jgi:hypothetical protein
VKLEFAKKKSELGARDAAADLKVGEASFYNYVNGTTIPDIMFSGGQKRCGRSSGQS